MDGELALERNRTSVQPDSAFGGVYGILMGWQLHVSDKIAAGQLVRLLPHTMPSTDGHYLVVKNERKTFRSSNR
ncbi:hypothetical protein B5M44_16065 [Shinella sumterensis]|nr:hypothetical protein B5M44_16065 [Shinella sumterensis]